MGERKIRGSLKVIIMSAKPFDERKEKEKVRKLFLTEIEDNPEIEDEFQDKLTHQWIEQMRRIDNVYISVKGEWKKRLFKKSKAKLQLTLTGIYEAPLITMIY